MHRHLAPVALLALTLLAGPPAHAGGGAPVPEKPEGGPPSGRPGAILDDAKCQAVWRAAATSGDTLTSEQAGPVVANFRMVDTNADGKVTKDEFKDGCKKGMVQAQASKPAESGGGQTPQNPEKY